ncbi:ABC transporter permease [Haematomicrobium sanguinis]|uniref:ABC transporter permease n=1 Tax=Haematomicrobium sanguinis TaxID=479106 RepID=UPI00047A7C82|nr:ABC-2 family transporter protein [Haematomicrobium sanguinis]
MASPYRAVLGSRVRSQLQYKQSFLLDIFGSTLVAALELAELLVIFGRTETLGGLNFGAAALVFALANTAWGIADIVFGHMDRLPRYVRSGQLDSFLLRPLPVLLQLMSSEITLNKFGRLVAMAVLLVVAVLLAGVPFTLVSIGVLLLALMSGVVIYASILIAASGAQFYLIDAAEVTNAAVYGMKYAASMPTSILHGTLRIFFCFVLPAAFIGYLPVLLALGIDGPPGLPAWLGWWTPAAALVAAAMALLMWRAGLRHYKGTGS